MKADPCRLEQTVLKIVEGYPFRDFLHPQILDQVADYIHGRLKSCGGRTCYQDFKPGGAGADNRFRNVLSEFGPEDGPRVVVGAHYDVCGYDAKGKLSDEPMPGADDNASAVAGLLELARIFKDKPPSLRVELAAYSQEEPPFFGTPGMGSAVHSRSLKESKAKVLGMICLEMIGFFSDEPNSQKFPLPFLKHFYPTTANFISVVGKLGQGGFVRRVRNAMKASAGDLDIRSIAAPPIVQGIDYSDHRNYWKEGYKAVMITDTSFLRNPHYHQTTDTPDTLDYQRMARVVDGVYNAILQLG